MDAAKPERIRQRAYELWYGQGRPEGRSQEHWEQACREVDEVEGRDNLATADEELKKFAEI